MFQVVPSSLFTTQNIILKMLNILGVIFQPCQLFFVYVPLNTTYILFARNTAQNSIGCITCEFTLDYGSDHPPAMNSHFIQEIPLSSLEAKIFYPYNSQNPPRVGAKLKFVGVSSRLGLEFAK